MRIYKVNIEHTKFGRNFSGETVSAETFKQAVNKVEKLLRSSERIESVELLASTN